MSVLQPDKVDIIGINHQTNTVTLAISDHLDWNDPEGHLILLQDKINTYLRFFESGEIYETSPLSKGKNIVFQIYAKYPLPEEGIIFFEQAKKIIEGVGIDLLFTLFQGEDEN